MAATALPSRRFPSDHLSLCCDFEWLSPSAARTAAGQTPCDAPSAAQDTGVESRQSVESRPANRYPGRMGLRKKLPQPASPHLVYKGVSALGRGEVIAVPTDTVYGLAAAADSAAGVRRLYQVSVSFDFCACVHGGAPQVCARAKTALAAALVMQSL